MIPRKHAFEIMAWANGAEIEYKADHGGWVAMEYPSWDDRKEYRIKPKQSVVRWQWAYPSMNGWSATSYFYDEQEILKAIHDGCIKLEYTRTEFPE